MSQGSFLLQDIHMLRQMLLRPGSNISIETISLVVEEDKSVTDFSSRPSITRENRQTQMDVQRRMSSSSLSHISRRLTLLFIDNLFSFGYTFRSFQATVLTRQSVDLRWLVMIFIVLIVLS